MKRLNRKIRRPILRLLGDYQTMLEALIDSHTLPDGSTECRLDTPEQNALSAEIVAEARRDWRACEDAIKKLEGR